jgi:hypothetical protein
MTRFRFQHKPSTPNRLSFSVRVPNRAAARLQTITIAWATTRKEKAMRMTPSRAASLLAAAAASAVFAMLSAPTAAAVTCSDSEVAYDGTCVPPSSTYNVTAAAGIPDGSVNDVVASINQDSDDLDSIIAAPGFNGGGGGHGR